MSLSNWEFDLNAPGMTPFHRAGLLGLAASCRTERVRGWLKVHSVSIHTEGARLYIEGLPCEADAVHEFLTLLYEIGEDGLIRFPLLSQLNVVERAAVQNVLMMSFLQHIKSRPGSSKPVIRPRTEDNDTEYSFVPLKDFAHRSYNVANDIVEARKSGRFVQFPGWAMPGAMVKHSAHGKRTAMQDTPERFFSLILAPLGCMWYFARAYTKSGDWDPRIEAVVVVPHVSQLTDEAERLYRYYTSWHPEVSRIELVAGVADAAMRTAVALSLAAKQYRVSENLYVMCFGKVPWNKRQKTRTKVLMTVKPTAEMKRRYRDIWQHLHNKTYVLENGVQLEQVMPMREQIAENVLNHRPWYLGFSDFVLGHRGSLVRRWRKGLTKLVANEQMWDDQAKRAFVELLQQAVSNRYGQVNEKAEKAGADRSRAFEREYQRMVLDFAHCRTRDVFRYTLMRFVAQTYPRLKRDATDHVERDLLMRFAIEEQDWREVRDLCLLAIATYRGRFEKEVEQAMERSDERSQSSEVSGE